MEKYHVLEMIGEGSFGRVYKGRRKHSAQVRREAPGESASAGAEGWFLVAVGSRPSGLGTLSFLC